MIFAVVPAGGLSTRMGRPKLALPLGDRTVVEHVVSALRQGGCDQVLVVVGPHVPQLVTSAESAGAHVCLLAEPTPDMRATVEHGLRWLEERFQPRPEDAWVLAPGDHPTLDAEVVRCLIGEYTRVSGRGAFPIVIPTFHGRRGHPTLIAWRHVERLRLHPEDQGLNAYLRTLPGHVRELPMGDENVLLDLDTPEDYERLRKRYERRG
jgi:molybdenum cofactor cytidylyltransferase